MRIEAIELLNFRGIRELKLENLGNTVVIAGANGSGKSCIFDAIRLLKSAYGGYQQNEWQQWMAEFQINFANSAESFLSFFQDKSKPLSINIEFRLHPNERKYLQDHGKDLVRQSVWRLIAPEMYGWSSYKAAPMAAQYRDREAEVSQSTEKQWDEMLLELSQDTISGHIFASPGQELQFNPSKALELLFSTFAPGKLGVIDYHGAQRMYTREQISGINLDLNVQEQQNKNHALYNYNNKYSNVKSEMANSYIKELLAREAGVPLDKQNIISKTLEDLFKTFFPDKKFLGLTPTADGSLSFPVQTASGAIHDLNELSAGEKEVLFGYLRIRNSAPRYSLILIDEPELHLNPGLVRGLPRFYHEHLGLALDNQIWLITHSDTLLREVVGRPEYSVYHMRGVSANASAKQIQPLTLSEDIQRAVISLIGDIASYRPGSKIIIFEGGGDSDFDIYFARELFAELSPNANVISSGNKTRVRELHDVLDKASGAGILPFKTFSITDRDSESQLEVQSPRFMWDAYHIENYLLEPKYILKVLKDLASDNGNSEAGIYDKLRESASATLPSLVRHEILTKVNSTILSSLDLRFDPKRNDIAVAVSEALSRSMQRMEREQLGQINLTSLVAYEKTLVEKYRADLATDAWRKTFRGRDILKEFTSRHSSIGYDVFRGLVIARMKDEKFKPIGMKVVIDTILAA